jgi:hypothetical protein
MIENSLLAVDPSVLAMPYWDFSLDSVGGKFELDPELSIFSSNFFGSRNGAGDNFQVTDGLFGNWSISEWSSERFGKSSWLAKDPANRCSREEWFQGRKAELCDRCCLSSKWRYAQPDKAAGHCTCKEWDSSVWHSSRVRLVGPVRDLFGLYVFIFVRTSSLAVAFFSAASDLKRRFRPQSPSTCFARRRAFGPKPRLQAEAK